MVVRTIAIIATVYTVIGGALTLLGWLFGFPILTDWDGDGIAMLPNTSVAATTLGIGVLILLITQRPRAKARIVVRVLAGVAGLIGGLTLFQHVTGLNLGIDSLVVEAQWGFRGATSPGRMGPPASTTFFLLGGALFLGSFWHRKPYRHAAGMLAVVAIISPIVSATAYLYGADPLYSLDLTGIAQQTAIMLICLAVGITIAIDDYGLGGLLARKDTAGTIVRLLLPVTLALLLTTGWIEDFGEKQRWYDGAFGNAALTVVRIIMFTALLWWTAYVVSQQTRKRQRVEAELHESQQKFRTMVDAIPQLAWMARPDGWIYWYNERWYEYTGTTLEDMEGWGWQRVHDPEVLPRVMEEWTNSIEKGVPLDTVFPLRGADGAYRMFLTRVMPLKDAKGNVLQWFGTNTDISEQVEAQDVLRETNRMKDEFLATLSHELRTPISAILGWAQLLRSDKGKPNASASELEQGLEVIERNARLQSQIIEDLLDMNRILSGKIRLDVQSVKLSEVVNAAVDAIRPAATAKDLRLQCVCDPNISSVRGDPSRLQQVFYNLLTNAVKFTPRGGKIQVHGARVNSHVEISVSDTGVGIRHDFLPHVFERFRQQDASTTRTYGGLGLGLGIVKHLVELHGGSVHVASEGEHKGSTFTVHLPVSVAVLPTPEDSTRGRFHPGTPSWGEVDRAAQPESNMVDGVTALVVDDEPDAREMLRKLLERYGASVLVVSSALEALEQIPLNKPDILVCDIGMPGMNGYDLIKAVRRLTPEEGGRIPAIALTAFARSEDRTKSLRAGFQMHLSKPVETAELLASVANLSNGGSGDVK